jgi:hypothetical protein
MKAKHAIILLIFGYCLYFIGALFKILHTALADIMLTAASIFNVVGALLLLYKLLTYSKIKDFLEH